MSGANNDYFVLRRCNCVRCKQRPGFQSISEPVTASKADPMPELTTEPVFEPTLEPTSEHIAEPYLSLQMNL